MSAAKWNRKLHRAGAVVVALPFLVILCTGLLLQVKKQSEWIQPPSARGSTTELTAGFDQILEAARGAGVGIDSWEDVDRLDVRPGRGLVKVRAKNRWEVQVDSATASVLQVACRRSDWIESLHDGSWFHDRVKLLVFLPSAVVLLGLWASGMYLFLLPYLVMRRRKFR